MDPTLVLARFGPSLPASSSSDSSERPPYPARGRKGGKKRAPERTEPPRSDASPPMSHRLCTRLNRSPDSVGEHAPSPQSQLVVEARRARRGGWREEGLAAPPSRAIIIMFSSSP